MNGKTIATVCLNEAQNMVQSPYDTLFLSIPQMGHFEMVEQLKYRMRQKELPYVRSE